MYRDNITISFEFTTPDTSYIILLGAILTFFSLCLIAIQSKIDHGRNIHLNVFKRWQDLRSEIEKFKGKKGKKSKSKNKPEIAFRRYFELLHHEHMLKRYIEKDVWEGWIKSRRNEFKDLDKYGGKTHIDWWKAFENDCCDKNFKKFINGIIDN